MFNPTSASVAQNESSGMNQGSEDIDEDNNVQRRTSMYEQQQQNHILDRSAAASDIDRA